jgi:DNA-binding NarL/FixJ family response regulator
MELRILLVDDHQILRQGLRHLLERQEGMTVVAEASDGRRAVELVREHRPDVVVMDVAMPELNGVDATRQILAELEGTKVVALSMHSGRRYIAEMLRVGASAYLLKDSAFDELVQAIRTVSSGQTYLGSGVASVVVSDYLERLADEERASPPLTPREREVVQLLAEGRSTRQVADRLHVSIKTVETHRRQIMRKLEISSIAELTKYAVREGLSSL